MYAEQLKRYREIELNTMMLFKKCLKNALPRVNSMIKIESYNSVNALAFGASVEDAKCILGNKYRESIRKSTGSVQLFYDEVIIIFEKNTGSFTECVVHRNTELYIN